jgi:uncharacterized protein (UPF0332 family)
MSQLSRDLLAQADDLLIKDRKKPRQANVRRAASTAYYALFHFISAKVAKNLVGSTYDASEIRTWLARALEHGTMSRVCKTFGNQKDRPFQDLSAKLKLACAPQLETIARTFVDLQELRHRADYDLSEPITKAQAKKAAKEARNVLKLWEATEQSNPKLLQVFCLSLLNWNTLSKR